MNESWCVEERKEHWERRGGKRGKVEQILEEKGIGSDDPDPNSQEPCLGSLRSLSVGEHRGAVVLQLRSDAPSSGQSAASQPLSRFCIQSVVGWSATVLHLQVILLYFRPLKPLKSITYSAVTCRLRRHNETDRFY